MPAKAAKKSQVITVDALTKAINKRYGDGTIKVASDPSFVIKKIPCGILSIDMLLGGGFARGRHCEIFGGYSVGKTYTTYRLIAMAQQLGLRCIFFDVEGTFDPVFAASAGVDLDALTLPDDLKHGNQVVDLIETYLRSRIYDVIVVDSIAALLPKDELDKDMESGSYGTAQAKLMSAALRRLTTANKDTVIVYINQTRDSLGSVFQKRSITSGGKAMGFYAGTRLEMVRVENVKALTRVIDPVKGTEAKKPVVVGHRVLVRVEKDKTGSARRDDQTTFVFDYRTNAIDQVEDLMYLGRVQGWIHKQGNSWWLEGYEDEKQNGRARFKKWLRTNTAVAEDLEQWIRDYDEPEEIEDEEEVDEPEED